jgi:hypothetical protein
MDASSAEVNPTQDTYPELESAYDHFNKELWKGELPHCLLTLQRHSDSDGYFNADRFMHSNHDGVRSHEIALNPSHFVVNPLQYTLSIIVREMVSLRQHLAGTPGRRRYRNTQWAEWMQEVGLMPTITGEPGGRMTGEKVRHYIIEDGPFDRACATLLANGFSLSWVDRVPPSQIDFLTGDPKDELGAPGATLGLAAASDARTAVEGSSAPADAEHALPSGPAEVSEAPGLGEMLSDLVPAGLGDGLGAAIADLDGAGISGGSPAAGPMPPANQGPKKKQLAAPDRVALEAMGIDLTQAVKPKTRFRFQCPTCGDRAWGKKALMIGCLKPGCNNVRMVAADDDAPIQGAQP